MALAETMRAIDARLADDLPAALLASERAWMAGLRRCDLTAMLPEVGVGLPRFRLPDARGVVRCLPGFLGRGGLMLGLQRGAWCPYCRAELAAWQAALPDLRAVGMEPVAILPRSTADVGRLEGQLGLDFPLLGDLENHYARRLGLTVAIDAGRVRAYRRYLGAQIEAGPDGSCELSVPATFVLDGAGSVRSVQVHADYRRRPEPIEAVRVLTGHG